MKKIINDPSAVVQQSLAGFAAAHADLVTVNADPLFVTRAGGPVAAKVAVVSGGGSGHEPLHAGFVGRGMLDAAVPGAVFTSPTPDQIVAAARAVDAGAGVLFLVKNYTGDVLNFEMAAELLGADDVQTATVVIDDDVAVTDSTWTAGRRGVGGTVMVEKIVGAAAEQGARLADLATLGTKVNARVRSMGLALSGVVVPHAGTPSFVLGDNEIELGIGIHGEPGRERREMARADELVALMLDAILADLPVAAGESTLVMVNGMGGTPLIELYVAFDSARRYLGGRSIHVVRSLVGNYVTSLEMQGMSITVLRLDDELTKWWDAPADTPALRTREKQ